MEKILAIKWRRLGDTVLWTAALDALRQKFPKAQIDLALPKPYACLFSDDTRFNQHYLLSSSWKSQIEHVRQWRKQEYDLTLVFHASRKAGFLGKTSGSKCTVIHHHSRTPKNYGSDLRVVNLGKPLPATERDLNVVRTIGWSGTSPFPKIVCPELGKKQARTLLGNLNLDQLVVLSPGASRLAKQWPLESYAALVEKLAEKHTVCLLHENPEQLNRNPLAATRIARKAVWVQTPQLSEAAGIVALARCFVGSDSGLKHLAVALNVPTVTLFGPESVGEWHPYAMHQHIAIQKKVLCRDHSREVPGFEWCGHSICPLASHACLKQIDTEEVLEAIRRLI